MMGEMLKAHHKIHDTNSNTNTYKYKYCLGIGGSQLLAQ